MRAKCRYCGRIITSSPFYKVTVGGKSAYYCNKQEYDIVQKQAQMRDKTLSICSEILNRPADALINKEVSAWLQIANYEKITAYLVENKPYIIDQMGRKEFQNVYGERTRDQDPEVQRTPLVQVFLLKRGGCVSF